MRRILAWVAACGTGLAASCSNSPSTPGDGGADDASVDASGGVDATHGSSGSDARGDGPGSDATADASGTDATGDGPAKDATGDAVADGSGDGAADSAADSPTDSAGDSAGDSSSEAGTVACYAMRIDQQTANVAAPNTGWALGGGDWTLEAWIKAHDAFTGGVVFVLNEATLTNEVRLTYDDTTGSIGCTTYSGSCPCGKGTGNMSLAAGDIRDGAWHHAACVRVGGIGKLYLDGVESDTDIVSTSLTPASDIAFGQPSGFPSYVAAPVLVGPFRFSDLARYSSSFAPSQTWAVDSHTITQYLSGSPFAGALVDEAGGDNTSTSATGVSASSDSPCSPAAGGGDAGDAGDAADGSAGDANEAGDAGNAG
jgi:hypothetical protein